MRQGKLVLFLGKKIQCANLFFCFILSIYSLGTLLWLCWVRLHTLDIMIDEMRYQNEGNFIN